MKQKWIYATTHSNLKCSDVNRIMSKNKYYMSADIIPIEPEGDYDWYPCGSIIDGGAVFWFWRRRLYGS